MTTPKIWFCFTLFAAGLIAEEPGYHTYKHPGYSTTPLVTREGYHVHQDDRPSPNRVKVAPEFDGEGAPPSEDAIVLFDGSSLAQFQANEWKIEDGVLIATKGSLRTQKAFGDFQLHLEWRTPDPALASHTGNIGNSGIYIMGLYEVQIYDSYSSRIYADGSAGAVYGQTPPLVNITRPPHAWQTFDIIFHAPIFVEGELVKEAFITVLHNGVVVQNHTKVLGPTKHKSARAYKPHAERLPITFQAHGSPVSFRNIWIRDLD
ncbi:MAG: hypothetical protein SynsKO_37740 [Synoicihabitans sp.]